MPRLTYDGRTIETREGENVLDALLRTGVNVAFSCRSGVCHVCVQRCAEGDIPHVAQHGLSDDLRAQRYFLACRCVPLGDMQVERPSGLYTATQVHSKEMLSPDVCKLKLEPAFGATYRAGQFINLRRADGVVRSYSIASVPELDYFLELHVARKAGGAMSNWILDELKPGDELDMQGASGDCVYDPATRAQPMLLLGTGTGIAPLIGVARDALHHGHAGDIHLYHGARSADRFYLGGALRELERQHPNFRYYECLSDAAQAPAGTHAGRVQDVAFAQHRNVQGWQVFAAGRAEMVDHAEALAVEHGARPEAIHTDAFVFRDLRKTKRGATPPAAASESTGETRKYPPPDPELWTALREGPMLTEILTEFYTRVYADDKLAHFFDGVTRQRLIEKQYLFMRQILTGEKIYFGDRPRNTHHWMVISDELFDYRSHIMEAVLREHGLAEPMVRRYMDIEEYYRPDIVKAAAFPKKIGDIERPLEGFEELVMDVGTLCDTCGREVAAGEKVIFHVRLGKIYCSDCSRPHHHYVPA